MPVPYIHFGTTCRDAMLFYQKVLGGDLDITGFDQLPNAPKEVTDSDLVMHATLTTEKGPLFASDAYPGMPVTPQAAMSISWDAATTDEGRTVFDALAEGGEVLMPFEATFFSPGFGSVRDKFGTQWMIMTYPDVG